jgi:hypothetical protein
MKFTTTRNTTYRQGVGTVPKAWIEYTSFGPDEDLEDVYNSSIMKYFYEHIKLWDWDVCGDGTHDFVFEDGKAFRLQYSWRVEGYHEDDEENGLKDEWYIEDISFEDANVMGKEKERDWL